MMSKLIKKMELPSKTTKIVSQKEKIRLDIYLAAYFPIYSRMYFQKLIQNKKVKIEGLFPKVSRRVKKGEIIEIGFLPATEEKNVEPQNIPLDILYEDKDIIAVNKPAGMVVHPACGHSDGTLVNALLYYAVSEIRKSNRKNLSSWQEFSSFEDNRPGLVHRLDKDTSGVILIAKTRTSQFFLAKQFQRRKIEKTYWTLVVGAVKDKKGEIIAPLERSHYDRKKIIVGSSLSKEAITYFEVLERFPSFTLLEVKPKTGRTHQIRVHLSYIGHPVLGDREYCTKWDVGEKKVKRQLLHAYKLEFLHPTQNKMIKIEAPLPEDFGEILRILRETC